MVSRVRLVTPSLNAAPFIRETIESVLAQNFPGLEYVVIDGGSTDRTVEIARAYADRVRAEIVPGLSQAQAIRRGLEDTTAEFVGYLNADDLLFPGAIARLVEVLEADPAGAVVYGDADFIDRAGNSLGPYPTRSFDADALLRRCFICQPATLIRRSSYEAVGGIDGDLNLAMDYDLWLRLATRFPFRYVGEILAASRMHASNKTLSMRHEIYSEVFQVLRRRASYIPYDWVAGYAAFLIDGNDQFFDRSTSSATCALLSLPLGLWENRLRPLRYARDWLAHRSFVLSLSRRARRSGSLPVNRA